MFPYALMQAALRVRAVEVVVDVELAQQLERWSLTVAVARGIANILPPRYDRWFERRVRRLGPSLDVRHDKIAVSTDRTQTKLELVLTLLPASAAAVAAIDLRLSGPRLVVAPVDAPGATSLPSMRLGSALILAPDAYNTRTLAPNRGTDTLALVALSSDGESGQAAVRAATRAVCLLCRGTAIAQTACVIGTEPSPILIPVAP